MSSRNRYHEPSWMRAHERGAGNERGWRRGSRWFLFRFGFLSIPALIFGAMGLARAIFLLAERAGIFIPPPLIALMFVVVVLAAVSLFYGGLQRIGFPLRDIFAAAERVGGGDFSPRLIVRGPPFLRSIARAFNTMTARLEAHEKERRNLMADVAHELRTPLTVMRGRLEGLVDGVYARDDATLMQIVEETRHLERLVEDLRTLAHAEGGTLKLQREPTDLAVLIADVVRSFSASARVGGIELSSTAGDDLQLVEIDPIRIREVLWNLVSNALRHTPRGGQITVTVKRAGNDVAVAVSDTGSGIPADELPKIFDRFSKGVDSTGSGLGLAIARNLVSAHGGTIRADSRLGQGTTITFTVPSA